MSIDFHTVQDQLNHANGVPKGVWKKHYFVEMFQCLTDASRMSYSLDCEGQGRGYLHGAAGKRLT